MLRRLTEEKLEEILEAGIAEFGEQGLELLRCVREGGGDLCDDCLDVHATPFVVRRRRLSLE